MTLRDSIRKARGRLRRSKKHRHDAAPHSNRREKMARRTKFWKKRLAYLLRKLSQKPPKPPALPDVLTHARWGVSNEPQIHYRQSRPIDGLNTPHKLPLYTDCSGFSTDCYKWAGAPDPNDNGYNGSGYTGTMLASCQHVSKSEARAGDLVVYGNYPGEHVVILEEAGIVADPMTISHGQEAGPMRVRNSVEISSHGYAPAYYLRA